MRLTELGDFKIFFTEDVLSLLANYIQVEQGQHEAGGILLGQVKERDIYITRISFPSNRDRSSRYSFKRSKRNAQAIIDYEFYNSSKRTIYLGEWHTHPEELPTPSNVDRKMIKDQFSKNLLNEPFLLQYIQGTKGFYIGLIQTGEIIEKTLKDV